MRVCVQVMKFCECYKSVFFQLGDLLVREIMKLGVNFVVQRLFVGIVSNQYGRDSGHIVCTVMVVQYSHTCIKGIFLGFSSHCILFYYFCRYQRLVFRHKLYELREERNMKPETFASLVSALLYEKRQAKCYTNKAYISWCIPYIWRMALFCMSMNQAINRMLCTIIKPRNLLYIPLHCQTYSKIARHFSCHKIVGRKGTKAIVAYSHQVCLVIQNTEEDNAFISQKYETFISILTITKQAFRAIIKYFLPCQLFALLLLQTCPQLFLPVSSFFICSSSVYSKSLILYKVHFLSLVAHKSFLTLQLVCTSMLLKL